MAATLTRRLFLGTAPVGAAAASMTVADALLIPTQAQARETPGDQSAAPAIQFSTLAQAQQAAERSMVGPEQTVVVYNNQFPGDGGGLLGVVVDPNKPRLKPHPLANRIAPVSPEMSPAAFGAETEPSTGTQAWLDHRGALRMDRTVMVEGQLSYHSNTLIKGQPGAELRVSGYSVTGSFVTNRSIEVGPPKPARNVVFEDVNISGVHYPKPEYHHITQGGLDAVTLSASASSVDGAYDGMILQICGGGVRAAFRHIRRYDGRLRRAFFNSALPKAPEAGDPIVIGFNDNALAAIGGSENIQVVRGRYSDFAPETQVPFAAGGKGINFESGVINSRISGASFANCSTAVFFQGIDVAYSGTRAERNTLHLRAESIHAEQCGSAVTLAGLNRNEMPDGDPSTQMVSVSGVTYHNCGHAPFRIVPSDKQKNGVVNLLEAQNFRITDVSGFNDATYPQIAPGYPTDLEARAGYGLSGPIGAMIWGHGRNGVIQNFTHHGDVDQVIRIQRARALGDDAAGQRGLARNCFDLRFENIHLHGTCNHAVAVDAPERQVPDDELTGVFSIVLDRVRDGLCSSNMLGYEGLTLDLTERATGRRVIGTPGQIINAGNHFDAFPRGLNDLRGMVEALFGPGEAIAFTPPASSGELSFGPVSGKDGGLALAGRVAYSVDGVFEVMPMGIGMSVILGIGLLSSGGGVEGRLYLYVAEDGRIHIKNAFGGSRRLRLRWC